MENIIYTFDGTFYGFLTVIFDCFKNKTFECYITENKIIQESFLFEYVNIKTDLKKAERVIAGIKNKISEKAFQNIYAAFFNFKKERFTDILKYLQLGFKVGKKIDDYKIYDFVLNVLKKREAVFREAHLFLEFIRFSETKENVLYSEICPDNDVLEIVANYFSDRLISEKWIIYDTKRKKCAVYNKDDILIMNDVESLNILNSDNEIMWQNLWREFFKTIAVENRKNVKLQTQMLPKKFRKNMIEFL